MLRGLYAAGSGAITNSRALNITSNNVANLQTAGFKKEGLVSASFGQYLTNRSSDGAAIGETTHGAVPAGTYTLFDQGALGETGGDYDLAIGGDGFFTVRLPDGTEGLTRCGQFQLNADGYLSDMQGNLVLGTQGPILVGGADFRVDAGGAVTLDGRAAGDLRITVPEDMNALIKAEGALYTNAGNSLPFQGEIRQGYLESSNVDMTGEMTDMIEHSRAFQSCTQLIRMMDGILEKSANELGRL